LPGIIVAAPSSSSGKTTVTLALLRMLAQDQHSVVPLKVGPDYIDPGFHQAACGVPCWNLDAWALSDQSFAAVVHDAETRARTVVAEGVMGLFDGATPTEGATADVAAMTGWPVLLVVDANGMAGSIAALVHGFATFRADIKIGGVIANKVGSARHTALLREALEPTGVPLLGGLPRDTELALPSRHLGLVLAEERPQLEQFLDHAAAQLRAQVDIEQLLALACDTSLAAAEGQLKLTPPGQRIAVANDIAFAFSYPRTLALWREAGAQVLPFSPLADETPDANADVVYLPGGYPELHAGQLANNRRFLHGLTAAASRGAFVFGECGGYMMLGDALTDADGATHRMAGLLPVHTSFAERQLNLGYRRVQILEDGPLGDVGSYWRGHEFHFSKVVDEAIGGALFAAADARGNDLGHMGLRHANVAGSYIHLVDSE
jgi:cobyrinic acid a,c-diamide synthase